MDRACPVGTDDLLVTSYSNREGVIVKSVFVSHRLGRGGIGRVT